MMASQPLGDLCVGQACWQSSIEVSDSGSQWRAVLLPRGHLATCGDISSCHSWRGCYWRLADKAGMLLNIP